MSDKRSNLKNILFAVLLLTLLGSLFFGFKYYKEAQVAKETESQFIEEKSFAENELKIVQGQYEQLLSENTSGKDEVLAEKERLALLLDSIKGLKPNDELIKKLKSEKAYYKKRFQILSKENKLLVAANKQLKTEKAQLSQSLSAIATQKKAVEERVNTIVQEKQVIVEKNKELESVMEDAKRVMISNISASAVKIKDSNKVIKVSKARRANGIEVCYDIPASTFTDPGQKELFIQVITPLKTVLGGGEYQLEVNGRMLSFSKVSKFRYDNKAVTICDFVEPEEDEYLEEGTYMVNVFEGSNLIDSSTLELK